MIKVTRKETYKKYDDMIHDYYEYLKDLHKKSNGRKIEPLSLEEWLNEKVVVKEHKDEETL